MKSLCAALRNKYGLSGVVTAGKTLATDILLDTANRQELEQLLGANSIRQIYFLEGLTIEGETAGKDHAGEFPFRSLPGIFEAAVKYRVEKVFWAGNITLSMDIASGTLAYIDYWCNFYFQKLRLDIRGIRFPFILSPGSEECGPMSSYVETACRYALEKRAYTCFFAEDTFLPWIFLPDALRAVLEFMDAPKEQLKFSTVYDVNGMAFAPCDLADEICRQLPGFNITFQPDRRDHLARQLSATLSCDNAQRDWGWKPAYNLERTVAAIIRSIAPEPGFPLPPGQARQLYEFYPHETF